MLNVLTPLILAVGIEFKVNSYTSFNQNLPTIQSNYNENFTITWTSNQDPYVLAFSPYVQSGGTCYKPIGNVCGSACEITTNTPFNVNRNSLGIYKQLFDKEGVKLGSELKVNFYQYNHQQYSSVQMLPNGNTLFSWESSDALTNTCGCGVVSMPPITHAAQDSSGYGIFARLLLPSDSFSVIDFQVNTYVIGDQRNPAVGTFLDSSAVIVWQSINQDSSGWGVFGQRLAASGNRIGSEFSVNLHTSGDQINPTIATFSSGQFVIVWQSDAQDGSGYGIYGRLYDASANPGTEFRINTYTLNSQTNPAIASFSAGEFVVVWQSFGQDGSNYGIYGQRFSKEAIPFDSEFQINTYTSGDQTNPSITTFKNGDFLVTWDSAGQDGSGSAVVARRFQVLPGINLKTGELLINEGGTTLITPQIFNVTGDHPLTHLVIIIDEIQNAQFRKAPLNISISEFSQQEILDGQIYLSHDDSELAPKFNITVSNGFLTLPSVSANVTYIPINDPPRFIKNSLPVTQGQRMILSANELQAFDPDSPLEELNFTISNFQQGHFESLALGNMSITNFLQKNITDGDIVFVHDGTTIAPSYMVTISDGQLEIGPQLAIIAFNGFALVNNQLTIAEGQSIVLTLNNFDAVTSSNTPANQLTLIASNVQHGQFERLSFPSVGIVSFNLQEIQYNAIRFVHDNSEFPPSFSMVLSDDITTIAPRMAVVTFIPVNNVPILTQNQLVLTEGETVVLTSQYLSATDRDNPSDDLMFILSNIQQGRFEYSNHSGVAITSFSQKQIIQGLIQFVHDGGELTPNYHVSVNDGLLSTPSQSALVTFQNINDSPVLLLNQLSIREGESVIITSNQLNVFDSDNSPTELNIQINISEHGYFERVFSAGNAIYQFTQQDVLFGFIRFVHDGGEIAPNYTLSVSDEIETTPSQLAIITYSPVNDAPIMERNQLSLAEGEMLVVTTQHLSATDTDNPSGDLVFTLSNVQQGQFEYSNSSGIAITSFPQNLIVQGLVRFVHNGGELAPSYQVSVNDGLTNTPSQPSLISFRNVNDPPAILLNQLSIREGESLVISSNQLEIIDPDNSPSELSIQVELFEHCYFEQVFNLGNAIFSFTQQDLQLGFIRIVHDGNEIPPNYTLSASDGVAVTISQAMIITYTSVNDMPVLTNNQLRLIEGDLVILTNEDLAASDSDTPVGDLLFTMTGVQGGYFHFVNQSQRITSFSQQQISDRMIAFTHDQGNEAPHYFVTVGDGQLATTPMLVDIDFTAINDVPLIINNGFTLLQGGSVLLKPSDLSAEDEETTSDQLIFQIFNVSHGHFEYMTAPGVSINIFAQVKIKTAEIRFVSDGSSLTPSYAVQVSDGELASAANLASINFNLAPDLAEDSGLSTRDIVSLLSAMGSTGLAVLGYLWWRNKTNEHRHGYEFANHLRKLLNLEYYDFTKGPGEIYKSKMSRFTDYLDLTQENFYSHLTAQEKNAFVMCVAEIIRGRQLLERSNAPSGMFNWFLCFSTGWSSALKLQEFSKQSKSIADESVQVWKKEAEPLQRWHYTPRSTSDKWRAFCARENCWPPQRQRNQTLVAEVTLEGKETKTQSAIDMDTLNVLEASIPVLDGTGDISPRAQDTGTSQRAGGIGFFDGSTTLSSQQQVDQHLAAVQPAVGSETGALRVQV